MACTDDGTAMASAEELVVSIQKSPGNTARGSDVVAEAVGCALVANEIVRKLSGGSAMIGKVLKLVTSTATQVSLLAVDATIEERMATARGVAKSVGEIARETNIVRERVSSVAPSAQQALPFSRDAKASAERVISTSEQLKAIASRFQRSTIHS